MSPYEDEYEYDMLVTSMSAFAPHYLHLYSNRLTVTK